jgi:Dyp-type peroxidase family
VVRDTLELDQIQGNVIPGFNKEHQAVVLAHFRDASAGRTWLRRLRHDDVWEVTSAEEVVTFRQLRSLAEKRRRGKESELLSATWLNVAFTLGGLQALLGSPPPEGLFDGPISHEQFRDASDVHALLLVAADRPEDLANELVRQATQLADCGNTVLATVEGQRLPDSREHFGYKDGISQPNIEGAPDATPTSPLIRPGEFVLGYVDQAGERFAGNLDFAKNGSFLAFLKLRQHVGRFREALRTHGRGAGLSADELGTEIVGRTPEGGEIGESARAYSHIGRAHPGVGEVAPEDPDRHRIIRRGIPFGPALAPDVPDDGHERGLLFLAYQADIHRQFEHIWSHWLMNLDFPVTAAGEDPLTGAASSADGTRSVLVPRASAVKGGTARLNLPQFVNLEYGAYFFSPSISALARLTGESSAPHVVEPKVSMPSMSPNTIIIPTQASGQLDFVKLVYDQNPYDIKEIGTLVNGQVELDGPAVQYGAGNQYPNARSLPAYLASTAYTAGTAPGGKDLEKFPYWTFNNESVRISKSMRITYTWTGAPPQFTGYILIGFAGPVW